MKNNNIKKPVMTGKHGTMLSFPVFSGFGASWVSAFCETISKFLIFIFNRLSSQWNWKQHSNIIQKFVYNNAAFMCCFSWKTCVLPGEISKISQNVRIGF